MKIKIYSCISIFFFAGILLFAAFNNSYAQAPDWQWAHGGEGDNWDFGQDVATDPSGNVYVTGYFSSPSITIGTTTLFNSGSSPYDDMFIVKYDNNGNIVWAQKAGGTISDDGQAVTTDAAGNVYVTGYFRSSVMTFGSTTLALSGDYNIYLVKYDPNGSVVWATSASTVSSGYAYNNANGISIDAAGNIYITGLFESQTITFDAITLTNGGGTGTGDVFIVKYDSDGNIIWATSGGGSDEDGGMGIATNAFGDVFVSGYFHSATITLGGVTLTNSGIATFEIFIAKYDENGNFIWANDAGGTNDDFGRDVAADVFGNVYLIGEFYSNSITFNTITLNNSQAGGYSDMYLVKYNTNGNEVWAKKASDASYDYGMGVTTDLSGNIYITGYFESTITFGPFTLSSSGFNEEVFIAEYDSGGAVISAVQGSGNGPDYCYKIAIDGNNNLFITGGFASDSLHFGTATVGNSNYNASTYSYEMYVAKYGSSCTTVFYLDADHDGFGDFSTTVIACIPPKNYVLDSTDCDDTNALIYPGAFDIPNNGIDEDCDGADEIGTGMGSLSKNESLLSIFPNPTNGKFTIDLDLKGEDNEAAEIEVMNTMGQIVYSEKISASGNELKKEISLDHSLADGIYLVKVMVNDKIYSGRIVYQK